MFCRWCDSWGMKINFRKTVILSFHKSTFPSNFDYRIDQETLQRVSEYKYLGVIITHNLSWSSHIDYICNKSLKKLGYLRRTLRNSPKETKLMLYKSLIRPVLEYASPVWSPYKHMEINQIEGIQKKAVRFICRRYDRYFSPSSTLSSLNLAPLSDRRRVDALKFMYCIINGSCRLSQNTLISYAEPRTTRSQSKLNLVPYFARTNTFKYSFFPLAVEQWNLLPDSTRCLPLTEFLSALSSS